MLAEQQTILDSEVISKITKALIYCRTSGDDSERDSLSAQERTCQEYAASKGYEVIATLKESAKGVSGASFDAPELHRALEMAKQGLYGVLIIRDVARFSRDIEKFSFFEPRLRPYVKTEFVWQNFDDTPTGRFYKTMSVGIAQLERDMITQRFQSGKRDKIRERQSMIVGSREPFGFNVVKQNGRYKPVIVEKEAEIIRLIFKLCVEDGLSTYAIANRLTELKIPTYADLRGGAPHAKKRGRGEWCMSTIRQYLKNSLYYGEWKYGKLGTRKDTTLLSDGTFKETVRRKQNEPESLITVKVEPIVSKETWDKAQEQLKLNRTNKGRKPKHNYLLAKRTICKCSRIRYVERFTNKYKNKKYEYHYYSCRVALGGIVNKTCEIQQRINAEIVDTIVWNWLENILTNRGELNTRIANYKSEIEKQLEPLTFSLNITESELEPAKKEYRRILKAWTQADEFDRAFLEDDKKLLRKKLEALQGQYDKLKAEVDTLQESLSFAHWYFDMKQYHDERRQKAGIKEDTSTKWRVMVEGYEELFPFDNEDEVYLLAGGIDDRHMTLYKLWKDRENLTFEDKQQLIKRFNVMAYLSNDGSDIYVRVKCDLGEDFLRLLNLHSPFENATMK